MTLFDTITQAVAQAIADAHGNQNAAAKALGISRWAIVRLLKKHGLRDVHEEKDTSA